MIPFLRIFKCVQNCSDSFLPTSILSPQVYLSIICDLPSTSISNVCTGKYSLPFKCNDAHVIELFKIYSVFP